MRNAERLTLQETADELGVHYMTVYRYVRTGRLPAERAGTQWLIDPDEVARFRSEPATTRRRSTRTESPSHLAARMVAGDEAGAWTIIESALAGGREPEEVHLDLLAPALEMIGDDWEAGTLSVADEHRASTVANRLVGRLGPRFARRGPKRGSVVVGAPPGERHGLPCAIVADLLRGAGYEVLDSGADTPADSFVDSAHRAHRLVAVVIGVTTTGQDDAVRDTVESLRAAGVTVPILVGGAAVSGEEDARRLGADAWTGRDGREAVAAVDRAADRPAGG